MAAEVVAFAFADITGNEQHGELARRGLLKVPDQLWAGHLGHDHVADDEVEFLGPEDLDGFGAAPAGDRIIIQVLERIDRRHAHARIVLDEQDPRTGDMDIGSLGPLNRRMNPDLCRLFGTRQEDRDSGTALDLAFDSNLAPGLVGETENLA